MAMSPLCLLAFLVIQVSPVVGQGLRGQNKVDQATLAENVTVKEVESTLLAELTRTMGGSVNDHVERLEAALGQMYKSVPKESDGTLSHAVVRYMLHRFFVQESGWFIRGLEPGTGTQEVQNVQNSQEWVPSYLQTFLEELHGGRGISLRELAVLAATFEDLIHQETVSRLDETFSALEIPQHADLDESQLHQALDVFMMLYRLGPHKRGLLNGTKRVLRAHKVFSEKIKDWAQAKEWVHGLQLELAPASVHQPVNFTHATRVVEEIGKRYGKYNDGECNSLKSQLLDIEATKAGRVRLTEFYKKGMTGVFNFNEKIDYLRTLGALDESDPEQPYVIVPNYLASRPNCLVASGFYVVCCRNECEDLLGTLERKIAAPTAKPEQILEIVSTMSTATVQASRQLSDTLVQRLHSIAQANGNLVPLHGRLFAQWMHHAFPRECPYPQQAGTTSPQTPDEWMEATGQEDSKHSNEELQAHVDSDTCTLPKGPAAREHHDLKENELPWDEAEELLRPTWAEETVVASSPKSPRSIFTSLGLLSGVAGMVVSVWKLMPTSKAKLADAQYLPHFN